MKGYIQNIEKLTLENNNFREVLYTDKNMQLVIMSLLPKEEIGEEIHHVDQFLRIEKGVGRVVLDDLIQDIESGSVIVVPAGTKHNIINTSDDFMKLYTIYTPPHHQDKVIHKTKKEAEEDDESFDGKVSS